MLNAPAAAYPGRGNPVQHAIPAGRSKFPIIPAVIVGLVVMLIDAASVAYLSRSSDGSRPPGEFVPNHEDWGALQYIRDDFPRLVTAHRYIYEMPNGKQGSCHATAKPDGNENTCHQTDTPGVHFVIKDFTVLSTVQKYLNSDEFRDSEIINGSKVVHTAEVKPAPSPALDGVPQMTVPPDSPTSIGSLAAIAYDAYFSFPTDPDRQGYLIMVRWTNHSADDIFRDWRSQAPRQMITRATLISPLPCVLSDRC